MQLPLDRLEQLLAIAGADYARLVLVVGEHGTGKTRLLLDLASTHGGAIVDVGAELPRLLFDVPPRRAPAAASDGFSDTLRQAVGVAIVDNIEALFHPALALDPLKMLKDNSRNRTIVAAWPGEFKDDELTFAEPGHFEYRSYRTADVRVLAL